MSNYSDISNFIETPQADSALQHAVEQFYYREALLIDHLHYEEWFNLLADDIHYFMPLRRNIMKSSRQAKENPYKEYSSVDEFAHFDDDIETLRGRINKLQSEYSWSENPASRTRHTVSNVIVKASKTVGTYEVSSAFIVYRNRLENQVDIFAGERRDVLRQTDTALGFNIAKRTILLDQSNILSNNLSIFF